MILTTILKKCSSLEPKLYIIGVVITKILFLHSVLLTLACTSALILAACIVDGDIKCLVCHIEHEVVTICRFQIPVCASAADVIIIIIAAIIISLAFIYS